VVTYYQTVHCDVQTAPLCGSTVHTDEQELYLEGLFKAEIVKNRPADAGYDAECRRYTIFKQVYLFTKITSATKY
jgi:hypothetical protein